MKYNNWTYKRFGRGIGNIILPLSSELDSSTEVYQQKELPFIPIFLIFSGLTVAIIVLLMIRIFPVKIKTSYEQSKPNNYLSLNIVENNKDKTTARLPAQKKLGSQSHNIEPAVLPDQNDCPAAPLKKSVTVPKVEISVKTLQTQNSVIKNPTSSSAKALISEADTMFTAVPTKESTPAKIKPDNNIPEHQPESLNIDSHKQNLEPVFETIKIDKDLNKIRGYKRKNAGEGLQVAHPEKRQVNSGSIVIDNINKAIPLPQSTGEEGIEQIESESSEKKIQSMDIDVQATLQSSISKGPLIENTPIRRESTVTATPQLVTGSANSLPESIHEAVHSPRMSSSSGLGIEAHARVGEKPQFETYAETELNNIADKSHKKSTELTSRRRISSTLNRGIKRADSGESNPLKINTVVEEISGQVENIFSGDTEKLKTGKGVKGTATLNNVLLKTDDFPVCLGLEEDSRIMSKIVKILKNSPTKRTCNSNVGTFHFEGDLRIMTLSVRLASKADVNFSNRCDFLSSALKCLANER